MSCRKKYLDANLALNRELSSHSNWPIKFEGRTIDHKVPIRDQQWIIFSVFISTHVIFDMSESTVLKANYSDILILNSTLIYRQQFTDSNKYEFNVNIKLIDSSYVWCAFSFRFINLKKYIQILWLKWFESSINIYRLSCCCIYKEGRKKKQTHNLQLSIIEFVCESYLF